MDAGEKFRLISLLMATCALLSACGGNGASQMTTTTSPASAPPPSPPPPNYNTAEYRRQPGLGLINVLPAYNLDADGGGVLAAIIDTGIDIDNSEFIGRIHPASADLVVAGVVDPADERAGGPDINDDDDHGTPLASIIGAARNGVGVHGVAPEVELLIFRTDDDGAAEERLIGEAIVEGFIRSANLGADIINMSFGNDDPAARAEFESLFSFAADNDIITVISAGNGGTADPDQSALGALDVAGPPTTIIAGAATQTGEITSYSNRAGEAADIFLLAPGDYIPVSFSGAAPGEVRLFSGTSASTPHIVGAAALILDLWPHLSASEVVEILLDSAIDLGAPGTDPIYGRGLLDVGAAVSPMGTITTTSITGASTAIGEISAQLPAGFGAGLQSLGGVVVFDRYGRDYRAGLGQTVAAAPGDLFRLEESFSPFTDYHYADARIGAGLVARMRLSSRDMAASALSAHNAVSYSGVNGAPQLREDRLAFALTGDFVGSGSLTLSQGFAPASVDRMNSDFRAAPNLTRSAFSDAYLPDREGALTALACWRLSGALGADMFAAYVYDFDSPGDELARAQQLTRDEWVRDDRRASVLRFGLDARFEKAAIRFEQGIRREAGAVLGARFGGPARASTVYTAVEGRWSPAPQWDMHGRYAVGLTKGATDGFGGLISDFSTIRSSQFSFSLARSSLFGDADRIWIGVSQPLRIDAGAARLILPSDYDGLSNRLSFTVINATLGQEGRQYDLEAGYRLNAGRLGPIDVNLVRQLIPGDGAKAHSIMLIRTQRAF